MSKVKERFGEAWRQNHAVKWVLILEGLVLLLLLANCFRARCDRIFGCGDLYMDSDVVQAVVLEDGAAYYLADLEENIEETTILHTDYFSLWPGAYRVSISYTSQVNYEEGTNYQNGNGYFYLTTVDDSIYTRFDTLFLRNGVTSLEQTIRVTSPWKLSGLMMSVSYYGLGELTVSSLEVKEILAFRFLLLFSVLFLFAVFDLIAYYLLLDRNFHYEKELGILTLVCLAAILPFVADYTYFGHDIDFHLQRLLFLSQELRNGNYFPAILSQALNGYGYAVPLYYGQIFLYIPAILYNCGVSLRVAYNIYVCLMSVAACLIMYYCALKIFRKTQTALLASALYTLSAVRLTNILTRAALGEFTAQTFYPLIFLGFYNIYTAPKNEKITIRKYWPIIVGLTAVVVSHLLSIVMCTMLILAFVLILIRKTLEPQRFLALLKAALLTLAVSLAQLLPMAVSMGMDANVFYTVNHIQNNGAYLVQIFNSVVNNYQGSMDESGYAFQEMSYSIGFSITLGLILFVVWKVRLKKKEEEEKIKSRFATLCWCAALVTLFLSTKAFFYDYLDCLPQSVYSVLTVYEFPWRWLSYATLFGVLCTAATVESKEIQHLFGTIPVSLILGAVLVFNTGQIYSDQLYTSEATIYQNVYNLDFAYSPEFIPAGTNHEGLYYTDLLYEEEQMTADDYHYENNHWQLNVTNDSAQEATVDIPVLCYNNYVAYDAVTGESLEISTGENNRIRIHIPAGYSGTAVVKYELPVLWKLAIAVSVATDLALVVYVVYFRWRKSVPKRESRKG